jgi:hypothetical protein
MHRRRRRLTNLPNQRHKPLNVKGAMPLRSARHYRDVARFCSLPEAAWEKIGCFKAT